MKKLAAALVALLACCAFPAVAAETAVLRSLEVFAFPYGALRMPSYISARVLAASVAESITVPSGAIYVAFSANCDFYVSYDSDTAVVPAADVDDGTSNELNPTVRYIPNLPTLSVISPSACVLTAAFFKQ